MLGIISDAHSSYCISDNFWMILWFSIYYFLTERLNGFFQELDEKSQDSSGHERPWTMIMSHTLMKWWLTVLNLNYKYYSIEFYGIKGSSVHFRLLVRNNLTSANIVIIFCNDRVYDYFSLHHATKSTSLHFVANCECWVDIKCFTKDRYVINRTSHWWFSNITLLNLN